MKKGDTFMNYALRTDLEDAYRAKVFGSMGCEGEDEDRHCSELDRRMKALDEKEVYISLKAFVEKHRKTVVKTLEYLQKKEGEQRK